MAVGKQIRLYLVDGTPGGLLTAEIMNWTGHVIAAPRSDLRELLGRSEAHRTGVYILIGDDPDAVGGTAVYIGEGDEIATRLRQHSRDESQGGKDFWNRVIILTSKDANLTKAHARYLESRMIADAIAAGRSMLVNSTQPSPIALPEADVSDMEYYLSQMHIVLPVLGVTALRVTRAQPAGGADAGAVSAVDGTSASSPLFEFEVPRHAVRATAQEIDGEFTVLEGSIGRARWVGTHRHPGYQQLHERLLADGTLAPHGGDLVVFTRDTVFASPSAAAAVASGRAANGRTSWIEAATGASFGDWQSRGID